MKICLIYSVWDDWYLLDYSYKNMRPLVDGVVIMASTYSNYGEYSEVPIRWRTHEVFEFTPSTNCHAMQNETDKRNTGLAIAKELGYTHFLISDADEVYHPEDFLREKQRFIDNPNLSGLVCKSNVYFGSPTLSIGEDITRVPFIHKLTPTIRHTFNRSYPYAWEKGQIRIDPTRSLNINSGVEWSDIKMEHYSWCRKDYQKKIRNSTARANLEKSTILQDLLNAKEGYFCQFYQKPLFRVTNWFNIPEYGVLDEDLQSGRSPVPSDNKTQ